jgi:hypothetical protein
LVDNSNTLDQVASGGFLDRLARSHAAFSFSSNGMTD